MGQPNTLPRTYGKAGLLSLKSFKPCFFKTDGPGDCRDRQVLRHQSPPTIHLIFIDVLSFVWHTYRKISSVEAGSAAPSCPLFSSWSDPFCGSDYGFLNLQFPSSTPTLK